MPLYPIFSDEFFVTNEVADRASLDVDISLKVTDDGPLLSLALDIGGTTVSFSCIVTEKGTSLEISDAKYDFTINKWARPAFEWWCRSYQGDKKIGMFDFMCRTFAKMLRQEPDAVLVQELARAVVLYGRVDVNNGQPISVSGEAASVDGFNVENVMKGASIWNSDAARYEAQAVDLEMQDPDEAVAEKIRHVRKNYYGRFGEGLPDDLLAQRQYELEQTRFTGEPVTPRLDWARLHNKYAGQRCFVIGNGPSLNKIDMSLLRPEWSIGVNSIFLHDEFKHGTPKHYVVEDVYVAEDRAHQIAEIDDRPCWFGQYLRGIIPDSDNVNWFNVALQYENCRDFPNFCGDLRGEAYVGGSVTYICMQIAYFLGFSEVYLIGFDHSYQVKEDVKAEGNKLVSTSDDPNHFDPTYFGAGFRWHVPNVERMERGYLRARLAFEADGRKIMNATPGGKLEVFPRVSFESLFDRSNIARSA